MNLAKALLLPAVLFLGALLSFFVFTGFAPHTTEYVQGVVDKFQR